MRLNDNLVVPWLVVSKEISLRGKSRYERLLWYFFAKILERDRAPSPRGKHLVDTKVISLEDWKECLDASAEHTNIGKHVVFSPKSRVDGVSSV